MSCNYDPPGNYIGEKPYWMCFLKFCLVFIYFSIFFVETSYDYYILSYGWLMCSPWHNFHPSLFYVFIVK
jgi:hypothetical protein